MQTACPNTNLFLLIIGVPSQLNLNILKGDALICTYNFSNALLPLQLSGYSIRLCSNALSRSMLSTSLFLYFQRVRINPMSSAASS